MSAGWLAGCVGGGGGGGDGGLGVLLDSIVLSWLAQLYDYLVAIGIPTPAPALEVFLVLSCSSRFFSSSPGYLVLTDLT